MEKEIKVSILVPFYNVEKYVGRCVESLFAQTYQNIEYVFVNDCTPDKSAEVILKYIEMYNVADRCKMITHQQNQGIIFLDVVILKNMLIIVLSSLRNTTIIMMRCYAQ